MKEENEIFRRTECEVPCRLVDSSKCGRSSKCSHSSKSHRKARVTMFCVDMLLHLCRVAAEKISVDLDEAVARIEERKTK